MAGKNGISKRLICLATTFAIMLLFSLGVSAAGNVVVTAVDSGEEPYGAIIDITEFDPNSPVTVLVYESGKTADKTTIKYIKQAITDKNGNASFSACLAAGKYDVKVNGAVAQSGLVLGTQVKYEITGSVALLSGTDCTKVSITCGEISTTAAEDGTFTIKVPVTGTYELSLSRPGYLARTVEAVVTEEGCDLGQISLKAGDANQDGIVDMDDFTGLMRYYKKTLDGTAANYDFNDSGVVDIDDVLPFIQNYKKRY